MPTIFAALPALSAAWVAANGVPLREPVMDDALLAALLEGLLPLAGGPFFLLGCCAFDWRRVAFCHVVPSVHR